MTATDYLKLFEILTNPHAKKQEAVALFEKFSIEHPKSKKLVQRYIDKVSVPGAFQVLETNAALRELLKASTQVVTIDDLILEDDTTQHIIYTLKEYRNIELLSQYGLTASRRLLFEGPPGTGKTSSASVIAQDLGLPLFIISLPGVIEGILGSTARNLQKIFDFLNTHEGVFLFDEIDALTLQRGTDQGTSGETHRILSAFLTMLDKHYSNSLIIGTTNVQHEMDSAIKRRFDKIIPYLLPSDQIRKELINKLIKQHKVAFSLSEVELNKLVEKSNKLSHAHITSLIQAGLKQKIINQLSDEETTQILNTLLSEYNRAYAE